jgi:hypothetical protein
MTNCGHLFCAHCAKKEHSRGGCSQCRATPIRLVQIGPGMKPDVQAAFVNLKDKMTGLYRAFEFQRKQMSRLVEILKKKVVRAEEQAREAEAR